MLKKPEFPLVYRVRLGKRFEPTGDVKKIVADLEDYYRREMPAQEQRTRMSTTSTTHLVLIPSYNTGSVLYPTVRAAREQWSPVWVVIDGSTDGSEVELLRMAGMIRDCA